MLPTQQPVPPLVAAQQRRTRLLGGALAACACVLFVGGTIATAVVLSGAMADRYAGGPALEDLDDAPPNLSFRSYAPVSPNATADPSSCAPTGCEPERCGTSAALASCLVYNPALAPTYLQAALDYWTQIDASQPLKFPAYGKNVARWEWPPWLLLTAYGDDQIRAVDSVNRGVSPYSIPDGERDCWVAETSPFARCRVRLFAVGVDVPIRGVSRPASCMIYEEFTFSDSGAVTFVEAWSDNLPKPPRMSTRIPGLGQPNTPIDVQHRSVWKPIALKDPDVNGFWLRVQNVLTLGLSLNLALVAAGGIPKEYADGCHFAD